MNAAVLSSSLVIRDDSSSSASVSPTHVHTHLQTVTKQLSLLEQGPLHILKHRRALFTQRMLVLREAVTGSDSVNRHMER